MRSTAVQEKNKTSSETRNSSALMLHAEIFTKSRGNEKVFGAVLRRRSLRTLVAAAGRGAYTQN
jgi:hypothetical protein